MWDLSRLGSSSTSSSICFYRFISIISFDSSCIRVTYSYASCCSFFCFFLSFFRCSFLFDELKFIVSRADWRYASRKCSIRIFSRFIYISSSRLCNVVIPKLSIKDSISCFLSLSTIWMKRRPNTLSAYYSSAFRSIKLCASPSSTFKPPVSQFRSVDNFCLLDFKISYLAFSENCSCSYRSFCVPSFES